MKVNNESDPLNVVVITGHKYPIGTALTNRIRSYLEALVCIGNNVTVIVYKPTETMDNSENSRSGILEGVNFISSARSIYKTDNRYLSRLTWVYSYINCLIILITMQKKDKIDVVIQASSKSTLIPFIYLLSLLLGFKYVLENSEFPWFILKKNRSSLFYKPLYLRVYYRMFDGVLAMTRTLASYHKTYAKKSAHIMHLPMTVDMKRFEMDLPRENLITYVGNVSYYKDGVGILVDAFILLAEEFPDWNLVIIGDTAQDNDVRKLAKTKNLEDRIVLKGSVHRDEVPEMLCKSKILALARPSSMQSEGGFPTKLGEYLATGNLCVVTGVGEIKDYLQDNVSALISVPDSVDKFAEKLKQGILHFNELSAVRRSGYNVCRENFNATVQGKRLDAFLKSII